MRYVLSDGDGYRTCSPLIHPRYSICDTARAMSLQCPDQALSDRGTLLSPYPFMKRLHYVENKYPPGSDRKTR